MDEIPPKPPENHQNHQKSQKLFFGVSGGRALRMHPENPKTPDFTKICWACDVCDVDVLEYTKNPKKATHFRLQEGFRTTSVCAAISKRKTHSCPFPFPNALIGIQCGQEVDVGRGRRRRNADQMPAKQARSSSSLSGDRIAFIVACINLLKYVAFAGAMRCTWSPA